MTNHCRDYKVRGCPASFYLSCPAYRSSKNCWEVQKKPCCPAENLSKCVACAVFAKGRAVMKEELI
jgi:hypothetical protein